MNGDSANLKVSLVVPLKDEADSVSNLFSSIESQTKAPDEVIFVDGGSEDDTVRRLVSLVDGDEKYRTIEIGDATPGRGRNAGTKEATNDWIAYTDAGIELEPDWLEKLAARVGGGVDIVYGLYSPSVESLFERIATFAYVGPKSRSGFRGRSIASCLIRKKVWESVGGFPDLRAAEDLAFMEKAEQMGFSHVTAPEAKVIWRLRPDVSSTFRKFVLYSFHNVLAGRQWDWHYGVLKQYLLLIPVLLLAIVHSWWWLALIPVWVLARAAKRIVSHRHEFGISPLFNPLTVIGVAGLTLVIDAATYIGWIKAKLAR